MGDKFTFQNVIFWFRSIFIDWWICRIKGHSFAYEPMEGDEPPFEFDYCAMCDHPNYKLDQYYDDDGDL